jgi:hypothetical protein
MAAARADRSLLLDKEELHDGTQWHPVVGYRLRPHVRR